LVGLFLSTFCESRTGYFPNPPQNRRAAPPALHFCSLPCYPQAPKPGASDQTQTIIKICRASFTSGREERLDGSYPTANQVSATPSLTYSEY